MNFRLRRSRLVTVATLARFLGVTIADILAHRAPDGGLYIVESGNLYVSENDFKKWQRSLIRRGRSNE